MCAAFDVKKGVQNARFVVRISQTGAEMCELECYNEPF